MSTINEKLDHIGSVVERINQIVRPLPGEDIADAALRITTERDKYKLENERLQKQLKAATEYRIGDVYIRQLGFTWVVRYEVEQEEIQYLSPAGWSITLYRYSNADSAFQALNAWNSEPKVICVGGVYGMTKDDLKKIHEQFRRDLKKLDGE